MKNTVTSREIVAKVLLQQGYQDFTNELRAAESSMPVTCWEAIVVWLRVAGATFLNSGSNREAMPPNFSLAAREPNHWLSGVLAGASHLREDALVFVPAWFLPEVRRVVAKAQESFTLIRGSNPQFQPNGHGRNAESIAKIMASRGCLDTAVDKEGWSTWFPGSPAADPIGWRSRQGELEGQLRAHGRTMASMFPSFSA